MKAFVILFFLSLAPGLIPGAFAEQTACFDIFRIDLEADFNEFVSNNFMDRAGRSMDTRARELFKNLMLSLKYPSVNGSWYSDSSSEAFAKEFWKQFRRGDFDETSDLKEMADFFNTFTKVYRNLSEEQTAFLRLQRYRASYVVSYVDESYHAGLALFVYAHYRHQALDESLIKKYFQLRTGSFPKIESNIFWDALNPYYPPMNHAQTILFLEKRYL